MNSAQFQSSAKSTAFNPLQAPDPTGAMRQQLNDQLRWMREDQQMVINDRQQFAAAMDRRMRDNQNVKQRDLEALAGMSKTLTDTLLQIKKDKDQNDLEEGLAFKYQVGIPPEEVAAFEEGEQQLVEARDATNAYADRLARNGAPQDLVEQVRNLNGWKRYGFMIGLAQDAGRKWSEFLDERLQSDDKTQVDLGNGVTITPQQAETKAQLEGVKTALMKQYLRANGLTGANPALLNKYLFPNMRDGEEQVISRRYRGIVTAKAQETIDENDGILATGLLSQGTAGAAFNAYVSNLRSIIDPKTGQLLGPGGARDRAIDVIIKLARDGQLDDSVIAEIENTLIPGSTTETWGSKFRDKFVGLRDIIREGKDADLAAQEREEARADKEREEQILALYAQKGGFTEAEKEEIKNAYYAAGKPMPGAIADLVTVEQKNDQDAIRYLEGQIANGRYFTERELRTSGFSPTVINRYLDKAKNYEIGIANNSEFKGRLQAIKDQLKFNLIGTATPGTPAHWTLALTQSIAEKIFKDKVLQLTTASVNPDKATADAFALVQKLIEDGKPSSKGPGTGVFALKPADGNSTVAEVNGGYIGVLGYLGRERAGVQEAQREFQQLTRRFIDRGRGDAAINSAGLVSTADLKRLDKLRQDPNAQFPASILWLASMTKLSPWDIADRQLQANNLPLLTRPPEVQWSSQQDPRLRRLLDFSPSFNRTQRAFSGTPWNINKVPNQWGVIVERAAKQYGLDPAVLAGLIQTESSWNPRAASGAGPVGLTQINTDTAAEAGISLSDRTSPEKAIFAGARLLSKRLAAAKGDLTLALRMYNMGVGGASRFPGGYPGDNESIGYPGKVLRAAAAYGYGFGAGSPFRRQEMMSPRLGFRSPTLDTLANTSRLHVVRDSKGNPVSGLCTTVVLETLAANGLPNPQATGKDPGNNPRGLAAQLVRRYGWKPLPGLGTPQTIVSPYGKFTANVMTNDEYQRAIQAGRIPSGALSFATQWNDWNGNSPGSRGFDVAIVRNRGQNHFNGSMAGTQIYGDQKLVFVLVHSGGGLS